MVPLDLVEPQRIRQCGQDRGGGVCVPALLEPGQIVHAHARQRRDLLTPQARCATAAPRFNKFDTSFVVDAAGTAAIEATIYLDSFDTGNEQRDGHVRSADLLDVEKRPTLHFKVLEPIQVAEEFEVTGEVTLGSVTKPATLDVEWGGVQENRGDSKRHAGFSATGTIKRSDFVAAALPTAMLSDKIAIELDIQLVEPQA